MEAAFLQFSKATGIYDFMNSAWGWPTVESLHFIGLSLLLGTVGIFDLRVLGVAPAIPLRALHRLIPFGVAGYFINVCTGIMFVTSVPDQYIYNPAFQSKLLCMAGAGINMLLFYRIAYTDLMVAEPSGLALKKARLFALISLICWLGVITGGRLITFYRPPYHWCFWCG